jgi:hypothetical protein
MRSRSCPSPLRLGLLRHVLAVISTAPQDPLTVAIASGNRLSSLSLASDLAVRMFDRMLRDRLVRRDDLCVSLTPQGERFVAMLSRIYELEWAVRQAGTRIVRFTRTGERQFEALFAAAGKR